VDETHFREPKEQPEMQERVIDFVMSLVRHRTAAIKGQWR